MTPLNLQQRLTSRQKLACAGLAYCGMAVCLVVGLANGAEARDRRNTWRALPNAPVAARLPTESTHFGVSRLDEYAWLRASNWQEAIATPAKLPQAIRSYLDAENRYASRSLASTRSLQRRLLAEMRGRIEPHSTTPARPDGPWAYFERELPGREYPVYLRRPRKGGPAQILLDGNRLARGHDAFELAGVAHSPDHRYLAYAVDVTGSEDFAIRIRDLARKRDLPVEIERSEGVPVWAADSRSFFYLRREGGRALTVARHVLGTPATADTQVYAEADPAFLLTLGKTTSGRYILITAEDSRTNEVHVLDAEQPQLPPRLVIGRAAGERHAIEHQGDRFIILTNTAGAVDFRIVEAPVAMPDRAHWQAMVEHRPGINIVRHAVTARHLVRLERERGTPRVVIRRLADGVEHTISFGQEPHALDFDVGLEFATDTLRLTHQTMRSPPRTFRHHMQTGRRQLIRAQSIPTGHDPARYVTRRVLAPAVDGAHVPVSLLYRKGTRLDGGAPLLLYGYGAYGTATEPTYDSDVFSLVDRGFVYALAHVRGGGEMGQAWRDAGMLDTKSNSIGDFIAAAEHLARRRYTARGRIIASGASAGGLLVAAALNRRPDHFLGAILEAPFVDTLNSMLDPELPLTPTEWNEWGNPIASKAAYEAIRAYSPYDNVAVMAYPAILALASLTDPRVTYWEPAKWVARLRAAKTDRNPLLFKTVEAAGHDGASGRFERLRTVALKYAFALRLAGKR
jgi:oligopeptidase B